jgi:hypothetical protein
LNGSEEIELCAADEGKETLGVVTAPDGNSSGHFKKVKDKLHTWIARISIGRLPLNISTGPAMSISSGWVFAMALGFLHDADREILLYLGGN